MGELTLRLGITATYIKEQPTKCSRFVPKNSKARNHTLPISELASYLITLLQETS